MTYPAPDKIPYDAWFDPEYKYEPDNDLPLKFNDRFDMYGASDADYAFSMHEQAYTLATQYHTTIGGSENV